MRRVGGLFGGVCRASWDGRSSRGFRVMRSGTLAVRASSPRGRARLGFALAALLACALVGLFVAGPSQAAIFGGSGPGPTITSDRSDYAPGATATLTGASWQPGEAVHIEVTDASGGTWNYSTNVNANSSGAFTTQFQLSSTAIATYLVTATGLLSGTATTSFTDAEQQELNQCQNGGIGKPLVAGQNSPWANGNAGKSNSHWAEAEFTPYRAVPKEPTAGTHNHVATTHQVFT